MTSRSSSGHRPVTFSNSAATGGGGGGRSPSESSLSACGSDIWSTLTGTLAPLASEGFRVVISRAHRPATGNAASCSSDHTSSSTISRRGPVASTAASRSAASRASVNGSAHFGSTCPISSLTRRASASLPTSRPSVTQYTRPRNQRRTRRSARTIFATVVFPNPPAPCTAVVMPTVPAERRSAATI